MANYELWYADEIGNRIAYINSIISFEYAKVLGGVGPFVMQLPQKNNLLNQIQVDRRVHIYRQPIGGVMAMDYTGYLRQFGFSTTVQGQNWRTFSGEDLNSILARRISAYYAGATESGFTSDYVDDAMKQLFTDNFIDNADYSGTPSPARDIDSLGFSVASDLSAGPQLTKSFAWRNVLAILQDLQAESKSNSNEVFFGIVPTSETTAQFRTWTGQPGADRTSATGVNPIVFNLENGNLASPKLSYDYRDEVTYIYAGGQGNESERQIATASDTSRLAESQLNRIEKFAWSQGKLSGTVQADADNELARLRPRVLLSADLLNTKLTPYGGINGWGLGDKVTVSYAGFQFDTIIRAVHVKVDGNGRETIKARVESE